MNPDQETKNISEIIADALRIKGISPEKLSQVTGISERSIGNLLEGKFQHLPAAPYIHGYIIKIAGVLGLDGEKLWADFTKNNEEIKRSGENDHLPKNRFIVPKVGKRVFYFFIVFAVIVIYVSLKIISFYKEPKLILNNFKDAEVVKTSALSLSGEIDPKNQLTINNEPVYPDKDGKFEKTIFLNQGMNSLNFKIKKTFGKEYLITKQVFYEEMATSTQTNGSN